MIQVYGVEEGIGFARYVGLWSPAMTTTILGSVSGSLITGFTDFSSLLLAELEEEGFFNEQANMINATAISPSITAKVPKM